MVGEWHVCKRTWRQGSVCCWHEVYSTVKDLIIDPQGYVLTDLVVKMQKDASRRIFGKRFSLRGAKVRVPISTVEKMGESILLKYGLDQLEQHVQRL